MKTFALIILITVAWSFGGVQAQGPAERAVDAAQETVDTAKNVGKSVARGAKKAGRKVADALTPDPDAQAFNVTVTEYRIDMPSSTKPGKTAFIVKNDGKQNHSFEVVGNGTDQTFHTNVPPKETKVLHVTLKKGTYTVYCPVDGHRGKGMEQKLTVR
jgi:uncharacterized cupredoxin-like copper-binding protein